MKKIAFTLLILCLTSTVFAQDYIIKEQTPTLAIGFQPQSFTYKAAEIDLDLRLAPRNWLTIAPRLQFGSPLVQPVDYSWDPTDDLVKGYGFGLTYRYFPITSRTKKMTDGSGPFVSAGLDYLNSSYKYLGTSNVNYYDENGDYAGFTIDESTVYKESINNLGLSVNIGYNWRIFDIMYLEAYMGVGVKMSDYVFDPVKRANLGEHTWDTGYSGYFVSSGLRIGVYLNRYKYELK
jgi:hypothetical protein